MESKEVQLNGFFLEDDNSVGDFDANTKAFKQHQIALANKIEDLTNVCFWGTKPKFCPYDYHLCRNNDPKQFIGTATMVPGRPVALNTTRVDGIAELKFRQVYINQYSTTLIDSEKIKALLSDSDLLNIPAWIIWQFKDRAMYYKLNPEHRFNIVLGYNTRTAQNLQHEHKPISEIPMEYLSDCTPDMFEWESSNDV